MDQHNSRRKRICYAAVFVILLFIEVLIALFVHDQFIRPYLGDALVVIVIYAAVRMMIPDCCRLLPLFIFLFAVMVECLQYFNPAELLGVENNPFLRIIIGSVFDVKDILCYGAGCFVLGIYEWNIKNRANL